MMKLSMDAIQTKKWIDDGAGFCFPSSAAFHALVPESLKNILAANKCLLNEANGQLGRLKKDLDSK